MTPLRTAVIGVGRFGRHLIRNLLASPQFVLHSLCDLQQPHPSRLPDVPYTSDYELLLDDPALDAVVIATPPGSHAILAEAALSAGKHVLCEKPFVLNSEACERLAIFAEARQRCLMIDCTAAYLAQIMTARRTIPWETIRSIHCRRFGPGRPDHALPIWWDLAPHDLAVLDLWRGGLPENWRMCRTATAARLTASDTGGPTISIDVGISDTSEREMVIQTAEGIRVFLQQQTHPEPLQAVLAQFADSIQNSTSSPTNGAQATRIARILEGVVHAIPC